MCVIIDNCVKHLCFGEPVHVDAQILLDWILKGDGRVAYGGKLLEELAESDKVRKFFVEMTRAGKAIGFAGEKLESIEKKLRNDGLCTSNDIHVLALAVASGARTLYTVDKALQTDFKNPRIINKPRGSIYHNSKHVKLLKHTGSCGLPNLSIKSSQPKRRKPKS